MSYNIVSLINPVMTIRVKQVNFRSEPINKLYGLPYVDMEQFQENA